jgi:polyphosphate kinase 2 (PPK2 family)
LNDRQRLVLHGQKLSPNLISERVWDERLADISYVEDYLARQGRIILKFFLCVPPSGQSKRLLERLNTPEKQRKPSLADIRERRYWDAYMHAFEQTIRETAMKHAPWYVVPTENKWFTRLIVAAAIVEAVEDLDRSYPKVDDAKKKEVATARAELAREGWPT